ncbi:glycoside hydrolase family 57 protein [Candidatus Woesearchaeota archaeon]|nr:MAG: alpha-amylase [archaeon GW2011_AR4]MBS3129610.1 glycoside hydrolase family 57 protein [Candidatus Woesearchaeota archaeon]HIH37681.1 polysaccharide deacetylase family protein [Candidatus Woesearchaeota archaeon]HIH49069.1 polysaccharide deacetylase family protein [Candidatus Woesearchaeota archaeon]HIJ02920.1 polysaccharide deacetylase family protein [Candidatus Woesearchaeota archaeon]
MVAICFYFQVHQPYRLRQYSLFDIGNNDHYEDEAKNKAIMEKVAHKCYIPANKLFLSMLHSHPDLKISYSISGTALEQMEKYSPETLSLFQQLVATGRVELLNETYYHSLSSIFSPQEFKEQVQMHRDIIKRLFGVTPSVFRNTELIYSNHIAMLAEEMGYKAILAEGADHILGWRSPNFVYKPTTANIKLLLKNYRLSDDIAFRFSNRDWAGWPLTAEKFTDWVNQANGSGEVINLFMDYETIGEHQWAETGIFHFFHHLPEKVLSHPDNLFMTPSEVAEKFDPVGELDIHHPISWADIERDLSAWASNSMQLHALHSLYNLEGAVKKKGDLRMIENWRKLQTSDNFYYMCTKWFSDGDVHKYFNPFDKPHNAFTSFINAYHDMVLRLKD